MLLINQDWDKIYEFEGQPLLSIPVINSNGELWGFNLHLGNTEDALGTFDSLKEIQNEISAILAADGPEYFISGFSDYDGSADFEALCECAEDYDANCNS